MRMASLGLAAIIALGTFAMTGCIRDHDDRGRIYTYDEHRSWHRPYEPYRRAYHEEHHEPGVELRIHN